MPRRRIDLPGGARWLLGSLAVLDMMVIAWMITPAGEWLDDALTLTAVATLGGRHELVLGLAAAGFMMLAGLAALTDGFTSATRVQIAFVVLAGTVSVVALAGAMSVLLLLVTGALVLGFVARPLRRR